VARKFVTLIGLQIIACSIGLLAGLVPGVSWTGMFTGMDYMSGGFIVAADDQRVRVTRVEDGSPAARAGFRAGDIIQIPASIGDVRAALDAVQNGEKRSFTVKRGEAELMIEAARSKPELAAIWYPHAWYPIAGALFLCIGILVFATSPLVPAPLWRSIPLIVIGLGIATGFGVELFLGTVFSRLRVYQRWPMGTGDEWHFHQGLIGISAGVLLAIFAAAEVRLRLAMSQSPAEPVK
jgi:hypothetical protein